MAQFPSPRIAELSYRFRTLGLGYANIGGLLMTMGYGYDSRRGPRALRRAHRDHDRRRLRHLGRDGGRARRLPRLRRERRADAPGHPQPPPRGARATSSTTRGSRVPPVALDHANCPDRALVNLAHAVWDEALELGEQHGFRNAQTTVIAPTGTIGLVMDCDTTGIEPDFALVKFKKLAGGGYFKIINRAVPRALVNLGYRPAEVEEIIAYAVGHGTLEGAPEINPTALDRPRLRPAGDREARGGAADRLRHPLRLQPVDARRGVLHRRPRHPGREAARPGLRPAAPPRLHPRADRGRQRLRLRHDDARRRAAPAARALRGLRLRQPLRQDRHALSLGREPHPDDGRGAELRLGRDLEDDQHAERRDDRRLQGGLRALLVARRQGERALPRRLEAVASRSRPR